MIAEVIDDIRVGVIHGPAGKIEPVWFDLNRRQHRIRQITNRWHERRGSQLLFHFHVTDDGALYELVYNSAEGVWHLEMIEILP
jgi:hypothetical protein